MFYIILLRLYNNNWREANRKNTKQTFRLYAGYRILSLSKCTIRTSPKREVTISKCMIRRIWNFWHPNKYAFMKIGEIRACFYFLQRQIKCMNRNRFKFIDAFDTSVQQRIRTIFNLGLNCIDGAFIHAAFCLCVRADSRRRQPYA